jgi:hypothetical protein
LDLRFTFFPASSFSPTLLVFSGFVWTPVVLVSRREIYTDETIFEDIFQNQHVILYPKIAKQIFLMPFLAMN